MRNSALVLMITSISCFLFAQESISEDVQQYVSHDRAIYLFQNLTVIDGNGTDPLLNQDIIIQGDRIASVGTDLEIPEGATVIDMEGKSAIPGLVMLHEHMFYPKATPEKAYGLNQMTYSFPKLYLAGGVTTMRTAGSIMLQADVAIKRAINKGVIPGPNIDVTSPHIDRERPPGTIFELGAISSTEHAVQSLDFYTEMGATSIKVYTLITREDLKAIVDAAHKRNIKVTGHLCSITYREAADLGIDNLEHGFYACSDFVDDKEPDRCDPFKLKKSLIDLPVDSERIGELIDYLIEKDVALTSTINVFEPYTNREVVPGGGVDALYSGAKEMVFKRWASKQNRDSIDYLLFDKFKIWEKQFYDAGGLLVAGTDPTYDGRIVAGYANMRLLEIFVEMGFTIPEAIKICSLNGAKYLEQEKEIGSIEVGKKADLIILEGDISKEISVIRSKKTVFKNGIGYDSEKLFDAAKGYVGIR